MWRLEAARAQEATGLRCSVQHVATEPSNSHVRPHESGERQQSEQEAEFWRSRDSARFWEVPMGRDIGMMPWLHGRTTGVLEAVRRARRFGRTPLLIDNTKDRVVDTFFLYRHAQVLEAKEMVVDERTGRRSRAQVLERARVRLVNALRYGQTFYIRMANTATSFKTHYTSVDSLPIELFDHRSIEALYDGSSLPAGNNLYGSTHPLAAALREADTDHGIFYVRPGFEVLVSTHHRADDFEELLARALPLEKLQPILPHVVHDSSVAQRSHADLLGASDAAPPLTAPATGAPPEAPWSLSDALEASIRMRERVERMRERRAAGLEGAGGTTSGAVAPLRSSGDDGGNGSADADGSAVAAAAAAGVDDDVDDDGSADANHGTSLADYARSRRCRGSDGTELVAPTGIPSSRERDLCEIALEYSAARAADDAGACAMLGAPHGSLAALRLDAEEARTEWQGGGGHHILDDDSDSRPLVTHCYARSERG